MGDTSSVIADEPVLAVCGFSGSGKTTLLEAVIPKLTARGLAVAVVKHDAHGLEVDREGKDSDRLFRAGATVVARGPGESFTRRRPRAEDELADLLRELVADHDLVLVEGHKATPLAKLWLQGAEGTVPPPDVTGVLEVLPLEADRIRALIARVEWCLDRSLRRRRVFGGLLVGGASRRMGRPKALLELGGRTIGERVASALAPRVERLLLLGAGPAPDALAGCERLPDPSGLAGPLAGILAALRWQPRATWVIAACDLPFASEEAVAWLLDQRAAGRWAVIPSRSGGGLEPLLAVYEPWALRPLERLAANAGRAPRELAALAAVATPAPPAALAAAWVNVNTPEDLARLHSGSAQDRSERRESSE